MAEDAEKLKCLELAAEVHKHANLDCCIGVFVDSPCKCFWGCCVCQLIFVVLSAATGSLSVKRRDGAWRIYSQKSTQYHVAWRQASEEVDGMDGRRLSMRRGPWDEDLDTEHMAETSTSLSGVFPYTSKFWMPQPAASNRRLKKDDGPEQFYFFYKANKAGTGNILTSANMQKMCELEKVALLNHGGHVDSVRSAAVLLYGYQNKLRSPVDWTCPLLPQAEIDNKTKPVWDDVKRLKTQSQYSRLVHPSFVDSGQTAYTQTIISVHGPDSEAWQKAVFKQLDVSYGFLRSAYQGEDDRFVQYGPLRVRIWESEADEMDKMISADFGIAIFSILFVYFVLYAYLRSFWLASWAMYQIVFSLPIGGFFYKNLFQVHYFEFLHILIVYLVLGVGADDIFVFCDCFWHQQQQEIAGNQELQGVALSRDRLHKILKESWKRSSGAIFNTSITTTIAFLSCSVSEVMPMRTCGWYAATCIVTVYIMTITFAPASLVIWHTYFQDQRCCCPPCKQRQRESSTVKSENEKAEDNEKAEESIPMKSDTEQTADKKKGYMAIALEKFYIPFMNFTHPGLPVWFRPGACLSVLIMLGVAIQGIVFTSKLTPPTKREVWFPSNHMALQLGPFISKNYYSPAHDDYTNIRFIWGIKELNLDKLETYRPDKFQDGVVFDSAFDLSTKEAQDHVLYVCKQMQIVTCNLEACDNKGYDTLMMQINYKTSSCFLEDMKNELNGTLPQGAAFYTALKKFRTHRNKDKYSSKALNAEYRKHIGMVDGELKYVAVQIRSTISRTEPYQSGVPVRDLVGKYVDEWKAKAPSSMKSIKHEASGLFQDYDLGSQLIAGFFSGLAISMPAAFLVLLFSTQNIVIAGYAVLTVAFIVCCVLGFCKSAMDWDLGIGEAIAGVIVIGYSVDFVVHLAHMYHEGGIHYSLAVRHERCEFAVKQLGTTIFAGAVTTAGAGMVMFVCFFYFFFKMALLITVTIAYSFMFAFLFFLPLMWLIGPNGTFGDLRNPLKGSNSNKVSPEETGASTPEEKYAGETSSQTKVVPISPPP